MLDHVIKYSIAVLNLGMLHIFCKWTLVQDSHNSAHNTQKAQGRWKMCDLLYHVRYPGTYYFKCLYKSVVVSALKNNVKCLINNDAK